MSIEAQFNGGLGVAPNRPSRGRMADNFICPPFSLLNAREGWWQKRKRDWIRLGIKGELGRDSNLLKHPKTTIDIGFYAKKRQAEKALGRKLSTEEFNPNAEGRADDLTFGTAGWLADKEGKELSEKLEKANRGLDPGAGKAMRRAKQAKGTAGLTGTSIFDPVLCEVAYRWFCPPGGQIIDPFAGGSVRGIVANELGFDYWGCDLRQEQIEANRAQAARICPDNPPTWVCGDSLETLGDAPRADFIWSCPPYGDLEVYSDDPKDLSAMDWAGFKAAYRDIIFLACERLKNNRFVAFLVGDFRDKETGAYRNFAGYTIHCFQRAGLQFYNEGILVTAVGSLPVRVNKAFEKNRKLGRTHQTLLVFVKGDWRKAAARCGPLAPQPKV